MIKKRDVAVYYHMFSGGLIFYRYGAFLINKKQTMKSQRDRGYRGHVLYTTNEIESLLAVICRYLQQHQFFPLFILFLPVFKGMLLKEDDNRNIPPGIEKVFFFT
jgi:hypothetical protein